MLSDRLGQETALVEADIAGGRTDQSGHRVFFHVFAHVEALEMDIENHRQLSCHLGLANAGRTGKEKTAGRRVGVAEAGPRPYHRRGYRADRLVLAENHRLETGRQLAQVVNFRAGTRFGRDSCHPRYHFLDITDLDNRALPAFQPEEGPDLVHHIDSLVREKTFVDKPE